MIVMIIIERFSYVSRMMISGEFKLLVPIIEAQSFKSIWNESKLFDSKVKLRG
jgi:hypothetical protein